MSTQDNGWTDAENFADDHNDQDDAPCELRAELGEHVRKNYLDTLVTGEVTTVDELVEILQDHDVTEYTGIGESGERQLREAVQKVMAADAADRDLAEDLPFDVNPDNLGDPLGIVVPLSFREELAQQLELEEGTVGEMLSVVFYQGADGVLATTTVLDQDKLNNLITELVERVATNPIEGIEMFIDRGDIDPDALDDLDQDDQPDQDAAEDGGEESQQPTNDDDSGDDQGNTSDNADDGDSDDDNSSGDDSDDQQPEHEWDRLGLSGRYANALLDAGLEDPTDLAQFVTDQEVTEPKVAIQTISGIGEAGVDEITDLVDDLDQFDPELRDPNQKPEMPGLEDAVDPDEHDQDDEVELVSGQLLRAYRQWRGQTIAETAEQVGISDSLLANVERGQYHMADKHYPNVADELNFEDDDRRTLLEMVSREREAKGTSSNSTSSRLSDYERELLAKADDMDDDQKDQLLSAAEEILG